MKKITLLAILLPAVALANGYDVPNVNPRDLAMVSSLVAAQDDAAAAYANPAALSKLEGLNLSLAGSILVLDTRWSGPGESTASPALVGQSSRLKFHPAPPVSLFAAYGFKLLDRGAGVGFGVTVPGGGNVYWPNDWAGRGRIITVDRKIYGFYLTGGYEVLPRLRLGGGLVYYYGVEYLKQGIQPLNDSYGELSTRGGGLAYDLSGEYTLPSFPLTVAVDYKHKGTMKLRGNAHFAVPAGLLPNNATPPVDQKARHTLTYPNVLNVGVAYRVVEPLLLTGAWTFNRYVVYQTDVFAGDQGTTITVPRHYRNGYTFRFGAEYDLRPRLQLRAGVERDLSGLDTDYYSATLPDSDAWAAGLGAGWDVSPDLSVQGGFFYAWLDKVTVTGTSELPGSYKTNVWIASLGVSWKTDLGSGR